MMYLVLGILGLALGSFVNALVWRMYEQSKVKSKKSKVKSQESKANKLSGSQNEYSILAGRSMCPSCKHQLAPRDLIPLFSWIQLGGKCRYCRKAIGLQYPLVEALTALLFLLSLAVWPYGFSVEGKLLFGSWLLLLTGLIALAVYDIKWMLLPNKLIYPLIVFWSALVLGRVAFFDGGLSLILSALLGALSCGGLFWVLYQLSGGAWIGGGDVKLGFLLGLLAGSPMQAILVILLASVLGTMWALPLLLNRHLNMKAQIPFGPFLIAAAVVVFLFGEWFLGAISGYLFLV